MQAVQSMPNLKEGSAAVWFREIKFMINLTGWVKAQCSVKLSSVSYCASLVASLKPKSSTINGPARGPDKSIIISGYSQCHFTCWFCSDQRNSLKHLILLWARVPTFGS